MTIKDWEDKHKELNEQIKVYQKSQKELEDSVALKDHNVEVTVTLVDLQPHTLVPNLNEAPPLTRNVSRQVLSDLLADLDACDAAKVLANGDIAPGSSNSVTT